MRNYIIFQGAVPLGQHPVTLSFLNLFKVEVIGLMVKAKQRRWFDKFCTEVLTGNTVSMKVKSFQNCSDVQGLDYI